MEIEKRATYSFEIGPDAIGNYHDIILTEDQALALRDALVEALVDTNK